MNQAHVYDTKTDQYINENLTLADFEDIPTGFLTPKLTEVYNKLKAKEQPVTEDTSVDNQDHYEPATDLFVV